MASEQQKQMNALYESIKERLSSPDIDLTTLRDIAEKVHLAATEPEAVTYAEVDAGGRAGAVVHPRALRSGSQCSQPQAAGSRAPGPASTAGAPDDGLRTDDRHHHLDQRVHPKEGVLFGALPSDRPPAARAAVR